MVDPEEEPLLGLLEPGDEPGLLELGLESLGKLLGLLPELVPDPGVLEPMASGCTP